jgi:hypothetical protein
MPTEHIIALLIALLIADRDKLNRAIKKRKNGRSAGAPKAQSQRMKAY